MADVAAAADVSGQTVSRVVNGSSRVDPVTRDRVERAMKTLGYRPNRAARALRTGTTQTIGLIATTLSQTGNSRLAQAISEAATAREYSLLVTTVGANGDIVAAFERLHDQGIDGAIVLNEATALARAAQTPTDLSLVVVDSPPDARFSIVSADHAGGAAAATEHLLDHGHDAVWLIAGPEDSFAADERERGWRAALEGRGISAPDLVRGDWTAASGYVAGAALAPHPEVTAIFAANDQMALGAMRALTDAGRSVPGDVSVVGFDDIEDSQEYQPPLTTIHQHFDEIGSRALAALIDRIADRNHRVDESVATSLVQRSSTAAGAERRS
mgnify:FL=1